MPLQQHSTGNKAKKASMSDMIAQYSMQLTVGCASISVFQYATNLITKPEFRDMIASNGYVSMQTFTLTFCSLVVAEMVLGLLCRSNLNFLRYPLAFVGIGLSVCYYFMTSGLPVTNLLILGFHIISAMMLLLPQKTLKIVEVQPDSANVTPEFEDVSHIRAHIGESPGLAVDEGYQSYFLGGAGKKVDANQN